MNAPIARRYAKALFSAAMEKQILPQVHSDLHDFAMILAQNSILHAYFYAPDVRYESRETLFEDLLTGKTPAILINFIKLLIQKNRQDHFLNIVREFDILFDHKMNIVPATVYTAVPVDDHFQAQILKVLESHFRAEILLALKVEPGLLGGIIVEAKGKKLDLSLKRRLQELEHELAHDVENVELSKVV
ncbi:MAG: ATP synthase F1 subunit delta [Calditrichaeota bacterium]|nr:MAG: ATP synthase F1 subunit delta [Calditrichota bacterium]